MGGEIQCNAVSVLLHRFKTDLDDQLFDILLPHKDAWRNGHVQTPDSFEAPSLFERAFSGLLFCKSMFVSTELDGQLNRPFLSLPAVRTCTSLDVFRPPRPLSVVEVIDWLNVGAHSKEPKRLEVHEDGLGDSAEKLVEDLTKVGLRVAKTLTLEAWSDF